MNTDKQRVLVIEDEYVVRESLRAWLKDDGYDVECVETGEEALEKIKAEDYGFLVLDVRLPGIDGIETFRQAKQIKPGSKGAIITAYPSKEAWEKAQRLGLTDFLPKPFSVLDLERVIGGALKEIDKQITKSKTGSRGEHRHVWMQLGSGPLQLCDYNYDCQSCPVQKDLDEYHTFIFLSDKQVEEAKKAPASERFCRYGTLQMHKRDKPYLE